MVEGQSGKGPLSGFHQLHCVHSQTLCTWDTWRLLVLDPLKAELDQTRALFSSVSGCAVRLVS